MITDPVEELVHRHRLDREVFVTRPTLPDLERFHGSLAEIWASGQLTNNGAFHQWFEAALGNYLDVEHVSLICNGTIALLIAFHALGISDGEVITTPFTFPATPHVLWWSGIVPVFSDIEPERYNLDPARIESLITPRTRAILPA